jgi:hypothetical protein
LTNDLIKELFSDDIYSGCRFIENQKLRLRYESICNEYFLEFSSGEFVYVLRSESLYIENIIYPFKSIGRYLFIENMKEFFYS